MRRSIGRAMLVPAAMALLGITWAQAAPAGPGEGVVMAQDSPSGPESPTRRQASPLKVSASADTTAIDWAGDVVHYTATVTNEGPVALSGITVVDNSQSPVCLKSGGPTIAVLAPGASEDCAGRYVATQADLDTNGGGDGTIRYAVSARAGDVSAKGAVSVAVNIKPSLTLEQSQTFTSDKGVTAAADRGDAIAYIYVVTNSGNVTLSDVFVTDRIGEGGPVGQIARETLIDDAPPYNDSSDSAPNDGKWTTLAPGDTVIFATSYTVSQADMDQRQ